MIYKLIFVATCLLPQSNSSDLLDALNAERGGRHWIDQQPDPPKLPEESLACFQIEPGSRIELVAAEPLVKDPVWIEFDHLGRMFVAEYSDYPIGPVDENGETVEGAEPLSQIVMLEDTDDDGVMDRRTVFADKLQFCHSFMPLMDGILAGAQTEIVFLKDTDGDNVADLREVWFDGFEPAHPQMQIGCPVWGLDNWIYLTYAPGNVRCCRPGFETDKAVRMPRQDMRFDPLTMAFEPVSGLGQFGNTVDRNGNRFFCTNRNPIMMEMIPQWAAKSNPYVTISKLHTDVGPSGGDTKVFPLVDMKSNYLSHAGTHTSACGVSAYLGDLWDDEFQPSVFVCEPVGHLVTRSIIEPIPNSPALTARRARLDADFLASTDTWFRPASLRTGPDGALYLADMYRMWVEHPKFLPPEIAARIDWRAGEDKGRIWRVVPTNAQRDPDQDAASQTAGATGSESRRLPESRTSTYQPPQSPRDLAIMLNEANGWRRMTGLRLLAERNTAIEESDFEAALAIRESKVSLQLLAAALKVALTGPQLAGISADLNNRPAKRPEAARLFFARASNTSQVRHNAVAVPADDNAAVRFEATLSCCALEGPDVAESLKSIVAKPMDHWLRQSVLLAAKDCSGELIEFLIESGNSDHNQELLHALASVVGQRGNADELSTTLGAAANCPDDRLPSRTAVLTGLARGLPRNRGEMKAKSLAELLANPPQAAVAVIPEIKATLDAATECATNPQRSPKDRVAAIELLSSQSAEVMSATLTKLLQPVVPTAVQLAAVEAARESRSAEMAQSLLDNWNGLAPAVKTQALGLLVARTNTTANLLHAMASGAITPSVIDIDQRVRLLQHRDESIRNLAGQVFGGVVSANRKAVADEYSAALTMDAASQRGALVFENTCNKCHRINGKGHNVGPDISDTRNRSRDALLYDILDPNRRVDPQFSEYVVVTTDGLSFSGLLVGDTGTAVVLRQPEGKEQTILRSDIEFFQATSKSLMPEGIEKDVSVQQMADLLEFLKQR